MHVEKIIQETFLIKLNEVAWEVWSEALQYSDVLLTCYIHELQRKDGPVHFAQLIWLAHNLALQLESATDT